jgi:predicted metal-binding protein
MTSEPREAKVPQGIGWEIKRQQLIIFCKSCGRRWKGDRLNDPANQDYLYGHVQDHKGIAHDTFIPLPHTEGDA